MTAPRISILTASFNALEGLRRTTASIQDQTFRDFEHIVIDGASSDGTGEWLASQSDAVRWVSEPDDGIADALNKGLAMANGDWVLILHSDDTFVHPSSLALASVHLGGPTDIVSFDVLFVTDSGSKRLRSRGLTLRTNFKTTIPHQGAFCRTGLFERIGLFDPRYQVALDYEFFLRSYRHDVGVKVVSEVLSAMPDTGISSRGDWASLAARFSEERSIHRLHAHQGLGRLIYLGYWPVYMGYRRLRYGISSLMGRT